MNLLIEHFLFGCCFHLLHVTSQKMRQCVRPKSVRWNMVISDRPLKSKRLPIIQSVVFLIKIEMFWLIELLMFSLDLGLLLIGLFLTFWPTNILEYSEVFRIFYSRMYKMNRIHLSRIDPCTWRQNSIGWFIINQHLFFFVFIGPNEHIYVRGQILTYIHTFSA